nr:uncharacterized protein LOC127331670 [Lolium perenne]
MVASKSSSWSSSSRSESSELDESDRSKSSPELILDSDGAAAAAVGAAAGVGRGTADGVRGGRRYLRVVGLGRIGRGGGGGGGRLNTGPTPHLWRAEFSPNCNCFRHGAPLEKRATTSAAPPSVRGCRAAVLRVFSRAGAGSGRERSWRARAVVAGEGGRGQGGGGRRPSWPRLWRAGRPAYGWWRRVPWWAVETGPWWAGRPAHGRWARKAVVGGGDGGRGGRAQPAAAARRRQAGQV